MEHKIVASEWDHGWFCDKCESLQHWKTKAYVENGEKFCEKCYKEKVDADYEID